MFPALAAVVPSSVGPRALPGMKGTDWSANPCMRRWSCQGSRQTPQTEISLALWDCDPAQVKRCCLVHCAWALPTGRGLTHAGELGRVCM